MANDTSVDDAIWWTGTDVDLDRLPVTIRRPGWQGIRRHFTHLAIYVFPALLLIWQILGPWWLGGGFLVALGVLCFVDFYNGLILSTAVPRAWRITFDRSLVTMEKTAFEILRTPYSDYEGVLYREVWSRFASPWPSRFQVIELYHRDPDRTVPLYVAQWGTAPRGRWKDYARRLGLPLLRMTGDGPVTLSLEELETTVQERAQSGALRALAPEGPPPKSVSLYRGDFLTEPALRIKYPYFRFSWPEALAMLFAVVPYIVLFIVKVIDTSDSWWEAAIMGGPLVCLIAGFLLYDVMTNELMIYVQPNSVSYTRRFGRNHAWDHLNDIEEVALDPSGRAVVVAGRSEQIEIGQGLSDEALEWLRDYILAAAARA